jgi:septum formation protein
MNPSEPLILASQSPRRRELLAQAGYRFRVVVPDESAECGVCSQETPPELVARLAFQKAANVARRTDTGIVIGCDTVAECQGSVLGKPANERHAREMLRLMRGREHRVYSGLCIWKRPEDQKQLAVEITRLRMDTISDDEIEQYLRTGAWEGKAGAFGYQDELPWIQILHGSESNVVGLPLELFEKLLGKLTGSNRS